MIQHHHLLKVVSQARHERLSQLIQSWCKLFHTMQEAAQVLWTQMLLNALSA
jgi:hypothetical protein